MYKCYSRLILDITFDRIRSPGDFESKGISGMVIELNICCCPVNCILSSRNRRLWWQKGWWPFNIFLEQYHQWRSDFPWLCDNWSVGNLCKNVAILKTTQIHTVKQVTFSEEYYKVDTTTNTHTVILNMLKTVKHLTTSIFLLVFWLCSSSIKGLGVDALHDPHKDGSNKK